MTEDIYTEQLDEILQLKEKVIELKFVLRTMLNDIEANRWKYDRVGDEWIEHARAALNNEVQSWIK